MIRTCVAVSELQSVASVDENRRGQGLRKPLERIPASVRSLLSFCWHARAITVRRLLYLRSLGTYVQVLIRRGGSVDLVLNGIFKPPGKHYIRIVGMVPT